jgi:uncharacterized YccA/Bax inhibitor family protein
MRTSNPTLKESTFNRYTYLTGAADPTTLMTVNGAINKSLILLTILLFSSVGGAYLTLSNPGNGMLIIGGGVIIGFALAIAITFKSEWAPALAPVYAIVEGFALGAISLYYESMYPGIVLNAVVITVSILGLMLLLYRTGIIRATPLFVRGMMFAMGGICVAYIADLVLRMFGLHVPFINDSTPLGIGISLFTCGVASLSFILDFDFIEKGAQRGAPKFMEWYAGFSLLVTLVWLYLEILRLLSKMRR